MISYEYALVPISATHAARIPLPMNQTAAERAAYLDAVPAEVLDTAERWPLLAAPVAADTTPAAALPDPDAPEQGGEE